MLDLRRRPRFTVEEYLEFELDHAGRFEYVDGLILAMSGAKPRHGAIAVNITGALHQRLRGRCRVLGSDQRIATGEGVYTYADVVVTCGPLQTTSFKGTATLHNPSLIVEVLSPSTREYDLGDKLDSYKTIPTLRHVLLIESDSEHVHHVRRTERGWETIELTSGAVELMETSIPLAEIYEDLPE